MNIGERIKYVREKADGKKLSMAAFAERIGVSSASVSQWENDQRNPDKAKIKLICSEFNINETWLLTGEGEMKAPDTDAQRIAKVVSQLRTEDEHLKNSLIYAITRANEEQLRLFLKEIIKELKRYGIEDFDD